LPRAISEGIITKFNNIRCAVLEGEIRVLVLEGVLRFLLNAPYPAMIRLADYNIDGVSLPPVADRSIANSSLISYFKAKFGQNTKFSVEYISQGGRIRTGMPDFILQGICEAVLEAQNTGEIDARFEDMAKRISKLATDLMNVGLVPLIDEATGYQKTRVHTVLAKILDKYIQPHFSEWSKTFPDEFYEHIFRLYDWQYDPQSVKRPSYIGIFTNEYVYKRLAPGVYEEIRKRKPEKRERIHQLFSGEIGYPALAQHIDRVVLIMELSHTLTEFKRHMNRRFPVIDANPSVLIKD